MMNPRSGDPARPFVFRVDPAALFQVNPALINSTLLNCRAESF